MKTTLIISTYNRPEALSVCLDSVRFQTVMPDEVIVGDDGSTSETKDLIESFKKDFPVPLIHLWQEDKGFRLAMLHPSPEDTFFLYLSAKKLETGVE